MRRAVLAAAVMVAVACQAPTTATPTGTPSATIVPVVTPSAAPSAPGSAAPSPSPSARPEPVPGIRARPTGPLPEAFRWAAIDQPIAYGFRTTLWLIDLSAGRAPKVAAEWDADSAPIGGHNISTDGRTVLVAAASARARNALYLLRPETGTTTVLYEEPGKVVVAPALTPDGQRFALTIQPQTGEYDEGIWTGLTSGGELRRIVEQPRFTNVPRMALGWSTDGVWLAYVRQRENSDIFLAHREGGPETPVGTGSRVSWRLNPPELLVADNSTISRIYTFDVTTRKAIEVARVEKRAFPLIQWHPTLERFMYVEGDVGREASGGVWIRSADGTGASSVDLGRSVFAPQWSRDGTMLTALGGGDEAIVPVIELFTGRRIAVLCRRGGTPPADCT